MREQLSLVDALERQQSEKEQLLLRRVRAFANRLRLLGFAAVVIGMLLTLALQAWGRGTGRLWVGYTMLGILLVTWLYSAAMLAVFWLRTRMSAYVLHSHWTWLAVLLGVPIDVVQVTWFRIRVPATLALILAGSLFWRRRMTRAEREARDRASAWSQLLPLSWNDLILMRFPKVHRHIEPGQSGE